uniref:kelch-like protein 12 n=1 Tax=Styela clava TaxID=7725 RepID=UPI0019398C02|nr:kelch-like protein 12 [Styela clava]
MIASTFNCIDLVESCNKYALKNFQSIAVRDYFKHFEKDFVSFLVGSKETKAGENIKCKALIIWTSYDIENRKSCFEEMFNKLDLGRITLSYQRHLIENEVLVFETNSCLRAIAILPFNRNNIKAKDVTLQDLSNQKLFFSEFPVDNAIAVFDKNSKAIQAFDPELKSWTKIQDIDDEFVGKEFTALVLDSIIYVLVFDGTNYQLDYTDTYASWIRLADRKMTKSRVAAVTFEGSIYAFDDSGKNSKTVEKFDPSDGTWSHVTDKPVEGYFTSIVAAGSFIYCIGGFNGKNLINTMKFNPSDSTWTTLPSMPTARNGAAAVKLDWKIYVMGGYNSGYLNIVEFFDTVTETWTTVACLNNSRYYFKTCVVERKIFAVGGNNSNNTIEEYDPAVNSWKVVDSMDGKNIRKWASIALNVPL